jgi:AraC family transcriptional regulator, transcriptional activator FtrA
VRPGGGRAPGRGRGGGGRPAAGRRPGGRATTHWLHADNLARRFPRVAVDPRVLYVDDGQVLTSAGTAAGVDLCLHVVRTDYGSEVANAVARRMVVPPHRDGGQAQFIDAPVAPDDGDAPIAVLLDWVREHLDEPLTVEALAARSMTSPRTFARRFRAATGTSPHRWITHERVVRAQELLETTDLSVDQVAERCGLGSAANLRKHLREAAAVTPTGYRRTFRAAG